MFPSSSVDMIKVILLQSARKNGGRSACKFEIVGAMQYRKWLSYIPEFLQEYIDELSNKTIDELSLQQINDYKDFLEQQKILKELEQFFKEDWALADVELIQAYINSHPLSEIKKSRLTDEEYKNIIAIIHQTIGDFSESNIDRVSDNFSVLNLKAFEEYKEDYDNLSITEAFIYYFAVY